jgi:hypothetical protein
MAAIALFGVVAYRGLAISDPPAVDTRPSTSTRTCRAAIR